MKNYYVGTHHPAWLWTPGRAFPMCVSRRWLQDRKTLGRALVPWILDSGGFTELSKGTPPVAWSISPEQYVAQVARYATQIGRLAWAAPMDWMCEPGVRALTGRGVEEHQALTVASYLRLTQLWPEHSGLPCPFIPVLQGWTMGSYAWCREMYAAAGVDLAAAPVVGVGSVCRRVNPLRIAAILGQHADLALHGFGVKTDGLALFGQYLASADSMAWSLDATHSPPLPGHTHKHCNNCREWAADWYRELPLHRYGIDQEANYG